jgi:hypothetical protein
MVLQSTMSVVDHEIPLGKSSEGQILRDHIFNMVAPYYLSTDDMEEVGTISKGQIDVLLESFTNTQKGVIYTSFLTNAKNWVRQKYFPSGGGYPPSSYTELLRLPPCKTMLEELDII